MQRIPRMYFFCISYDSLFLFFSLFSLPWFPSEPRRRMLQRPVKCLKWKTMGNLIKAQAEGSVRLASPQPNCPVWYSPDRQNFSPALQTLDLANNWFIGCQSTNTLCQVQSSQGKSSAKESSCSRGSCTLSLPCYIHLLTQLSVCQRDTQCLQMITDRI